MNTLRLKITLISDAEPGTGFGTAVVNSVVPRDATDRPCFPAAHLKGLLRDRLNNVCDVREGYSLFVDDLLGLPGECGNDGQAGALRISDAIPTERLEVRTVTRTAVGRRGTARDGTLRTSEMLPANSQWTANAWISEEPGSIPDLLTRLGLMSIEALGGNRTRGCGVCRIQIEGEHRRPGQLLIALDKKIKSTGAVVESSPHTTATSHTALPASGPCQWMQLVFRADAPVCCPETPVNGATNHIRSGPVIPASAVQGAILTRLNALSTSLASACYSDHRFRSWPLVPVSLADTPSDTSVLFGVRVDLMHRMSKLPEMTSGKRDVRDAAIKPYHWSSVAGGSPLKSSDGILVRNTDGSVRLWKAMELPRVISAHGVHAAATPDERRTLYTIEALAPMVFSGLLAMPPEAADALIDSLSENCDVQLGKARTVRGTGKLLAQRIPGPEAVLPQGLPTELPNQVFVVQSPLALSDEMKVTRAEVALKDLVEASGWGQVLLDSQTPEGRVLRTAATCGIRFGWNSLGLGEKARVHHKRLRARRVVLPGSVVVFAAPLTDWPTKLLKGIGDGRECGFGALLPHPGMAGPEPFLPASMLPEKESRNQAGRQAWILFEKAHGALGPSPGQLAALRRQIGHQPTEYLKQQRRRGSVDRVWHRWEPVFNDVMQLVGGDPELANDTLRTWQDLAIMHRNHDNGEQQP